MNEYCSLVIRSRVFWVWCFSCTKRPFPIWSTGVRTRRLQERRYEDTIHDGMAKNLGNVDSRQVGYNWRRVSCMTQKT